MCIGGNGQAQMYIPTSPVDGSEHNNEVPTPYPYYKQITTIHLGRLGRVLQYHCLLRI
jgi:hypothetical protein